MREIVKAWSIPAIMLTGVGLLVYAVQPHAPTRTAPTREQDRTELLHYRVLWLEQQVEILLADKAAAKLPAVKHAEPKPGKVREPEGDDIRAFAESLEEKAAGAGT